MNEHARLVRDAFHALSVGCIGFAAFGVDYDLGIRFIYVLVGLYSHFVAHLATAFGILPQKEP